MTELEKTVVRTETDRPTRTTRIPFGAPRTKLGVSMELPGYHLHWINDTVGRLAEAQQGGYTFVTPTEVGLPDKDTQIKRLVGKDETGEAIYAYLMKQQLDFYEEDQKTLQSQVDVFDKAMKRGELDMKPGEKRYNAGIQISTS
jgi:hypothetical protein